MLDRAGGRPYKEDHSNPSVPRRGSRVHARLRAQISAQSHILGKEERSMTVTRRDLLKGAALAGAAAALPGGLARPAAAQTTQKRELVVAQGGDIASLDPHMSTSS